MLRNITRESTASNKIRDTCYEILLGILLGLASVCKNIQLERQRKSSFPLVNFWDVFQVSTTQLLTKYEIHATKYYQGSYWAISSYQFAEDYKNRPQGVLKVVIHFLNNAAQPQGYDQMKKESNSSDLLPKKFQKVLMKIDEMVDVFLNLTNFAQQVLDCQKSLQLLT